MNPIHHHALPTRRTSNRRDKTAASIIAAAALFAMQIPPAFASDAEVGDRADHYEASIPETSAEAVTIAQDSMMLITAGMAEADFEAIHEQTYRLEAAAKRLVRALSENGEEAEQLTYRIEIVHLASELEDKTVLEPAIPGLQTALDIVLARQE